MRLVCETQTNGALSKKAQGKHRSPFSQLCVNHISVLSGEIDLFTILAGHLIHKQTVNKIEIMANFGATKYLLFKQQGPLDENHPTPQHVLYLSLERIKQGSSMHFHL